MRALLACAAFAVLSACATAPTVYAPATGPGAPGYSEFPIEDRRYRVTFVSGADVGVEASRDLALRRAADLTLERGFDWSDKINK